MISIAVTLALAVSTTHGAICRKECCRGGTELRAVSKAFGESRALDGVSLDIADGEFFALLGPSGCGKTTLLRLVAGFEMPDAGSVMLGDAVVGKPGWALPPEKRQDRHRLPVLRAVAEHDGRRERRLCLTRRRVAEPERVRIVNESLVKVGLEGLAERRPHELSGGQRQRVALARCLAMRPASCCSTSRSPISTCICAKRCRGVRALPQGDPRHHRSTSPMTRPRRWRSPIASR